MKRHSLHSTENFLRLVKNSFEIKPYFPAEVPPNSCAAAVVMAIYPPTPSKPNHFGLLRIVSDNFLGEVVTFEPADLYIHGVNIGACKDMSQILFNGTEVRIPFENNPFFQALD